MRLALPCLALVVLLAGCIDAPSTAGPEDPPLPEPVYTFACPTKKSETPTGGVCTHRIADLERSLQEPDLAIHPDDPRILVLGTIHVRPPTEALVGTHYEHARVDLHVSTDAGGTWTLRATPPVRTPGTPATGVMLTGDPSLGFTSDGRLHLTAMAASDIYHAYSDDLGTTWSDPTVLTWRAGETRSPPLNGGGGADRQWLTVLPDDRLVVTWQRPSERSEFAWSDDRGQTWSVHAPAELEGCVTISPAIFVNDQVLASCTTFEGDDDKTVRVHRLDVASGTAHLIGEARLPVAFSFLHALDDDTFLLIGNQRAAASVAVARSIDGARSWGPALDLRAHVSEEDDWSTATHYASHVDAFGHIHVVIEGLRITEYPFGDQEAATGAIHVRLAPDLDVRAETRLSPEPDPATDSSPFTASDHYGAIRRDGHDLIIAWGHKGGIQLGRLETAVTAPDEAD